jgi:hypothetical protein
MNSFLPNCRFLSVESDLLGKDWAEKSQMIDVQLDGLGMDLAEESVYLLFDRAPGSVKSGEATCQVARSVVGPKKELLGNLSMRDWIQAPVHRKALISSIWEDVLQECYSEWESLQRLGEATAPPYMIVAKRRLVPELSLSLEVLFYA